MANMIIHFPGNSPKALTLSYDDWVEQAEESNGEKEVFVPAGQTISFAEVI